MSKISVVINTYNAEEHLQKVLDAVKDFDEVVVCDMESGDNTVKIAEKNGCKVVTFPKADHKSAEPARTFAIQSATSEWVLVVDADEIVTPELREYLYKRIGEPDCPQGLYIPRINLFMQHEQHSSYPDYQLRFFVREGTEWPPYVHTFPTVKGRTEYIPRRRRELAFRHLADDTIASLMAKTNSYTDNEVYKRGERREERGENERGARCEERLRERLRVGASAGMGERSSGMRETGCEKAHNYGVWALFYRPFWRAFRNYFLKGGWRDGKRGVIRAGMDAVYQFVLVAKAIEAKIKK